MADAADKTLVLDTTPQQAGRFHATADAAAAAALPEAIRKRGIWRVGVMPWAPPTIFFAEDNRTPIGHDADIAHLIGDAFGLQTEVREVPWDTWALSLQVGEVDAIISSTLVQEELKDRFDFVNYRTSKYSFLARAGSTLKVEKPEDVSGKLVSVGSGTAREQILLGWNEILVEKGLPPIKLEYFESNDIAVVQLLSGRTELHFSGGDGADYSVATAPDKFTIAGEVESGWPSAADAAIVLSKKSDLAEAVRLAALHAINDGSYEKSLERWGLLKRAIKAPEINPPGLPKPEKN
ncbi:transporter substrate-binding domain-containing protein [Pseudochelatococcus sp. B33]